MNDRGVILIVDDEVSNIEIVAAALEDEHDLSFATSGKEALEVVEHVTPDLVLLDVMMPDMDGYEVCRRLKKIPRMADVPIIFSTALDGNDAEARGLSMGAIDYITKPISPIVVRARIHNHMEMKRMRDQLAQLAVTDALTGLSNRRRLESVMAEQAAALSETGGELSVIILDIDFFKRFNDEYGHAAGDRCIAMVAAALSRAVTRASDVTARYGGEEFACVLPNMGHADALAIAAAIRERVSRLGIPHRGSDAGPNVTVSVGVATAACRPGMRPADWIEAADAQLYSVKQHGRDGVAGCVFAAEPGTVPVP
jgi:diguanylate cyclase (GGDEF)-like protein